MDSFDVTPLTLLHTNQRDVMIKVLVIRQGSQKSRNSNSKSIRKLIFVDEQGTKIHGIIFANAMEHFRERLKVNRSYFISNPTIKEANINFPNVNQLFELVLHRDTIVTDIETQLGCYSLKSDFKEFADIKIHSQDAHEIDIIGVLKKAKQLYRFERPDKSFGYRREVVLINTLLETIIINLWVDLAINEGQFLHETEIMYPVAAFSNLKIQIYQGVIQLKSTTTTSMFLNPSCNEADTINSWLHDHVNEQSLEQLWMTKTIMESEEVTLALLLNERHTLQQNTYYYFKASVLEVENRANPWYDACSNCLRTTANTAERNNCMHCADFDIKIIPRYRVTIMVEQDDNKARLTLFEDVAAVFVGCPVEEYIRLLMENPPQSQYQSVLENPDNGEHKFLFRLDKNVQIQNGFLSIIVDALEKPAQKGNKENVLRKKGTSKKEESINSMGKKHAIRSCKKNGKEMQGMAHEQTMSTDVEDNETIQSFMKRKRERSKKRDSPKSSRKDCQTAVKVGQQQTTAIEIEDDGKISVFTDKKGQTIGMNKIGKSRVVKIKKEKL